MRRGGTQRQGQRSVVRRAIVEKIAAEKIAGVTREPGSTGMLGVRAGAAKGLTHRCRRVDRERLGPFSSNLGDLKLWLLSKYYIYIYIYISLSLSLYYTDTTVRRTCSPANRRSDARRLTHAAACSSPSSSATTTTAGEEPPVVVCRMACRHGAVREQCRAAPRGCSW